MNDEQIKNAMGTITYLKTTGEKIAPAVNISTGIEDPIAATTTRPNIIVGIAYIILKNCVNNWSIFGPAIEDPIPKVTPIM